MLRRSIKTNLLGLLRPTTVVLILLVAAASATGGGLVCHACKGDLVGPSIEYEGWSYHPSCYIKLFAPRCGVCGQPITESAWTIDQGVAYHDRCYEDSIAPRCAVCGRIIDGPYLENDWGEKYHAHHQDEVRRCFFCDRLITGEDLPGHQPLGGDRPVCPVCRRNGVTDPANANRLLGEIRATLQTFGIDLGALPLRLELVDPDELEELTAAPLDRTLGLFQGERRVFESGGPDDLKGTVYLTRGLPRPVFITSAGHELMHAWLFIHRLDNRDISLVEGSCNMAGVLALRSLMDDDAAWVRNSIERDPDPVYGEGYRRVAKLVKERGMTIWLDGLRTAPEFPDGY
jgi:hypothetical protein